jgi:hypothetical protein
MTDRVSRGDGVDVGIQGDRIAAMDNHGVAADRGFMRHGQAKPSHMLTIMKRVLSEVR